MSSETACPRTGPTKPTNGEADWQKQLTAQQRSRKAKALDHLSAINLPARWKETSVGFSAQPVVAFRHASPARPLDLPGAPPPPNATWLVARSPTSRNRPAKVCRSAPSSPQTADIRWRPARRWQPLIHPALPARRVRDYARQCRHGRIATTETVASYQPESAIRQVAIHPKLALPGPPSSPPPSILAAPPLSRILHGQPSPARLRSGSAIAELPAFPAFCALSQVRHTPRCAMPFWSVNLSEPCDNHANKRVSTDSTGFSRDN